MMEMDTLNSRGADRFDFVREDLDRLSVLFAWMQAGPYIAGLLDTVGNFARDAEISDFRPGQTFASDFVEAVPEQQRSQVVNQLHYHRKAFRAGYARYGRIAMGALAGWENFLAALPPETGDALKWAAANETARLEARIFNCAEYFGHDLMVDEKAAAEVFNVLRDLYI